MSMLDAGLATDVGKIRPSNQDRALVRSDLVAVADGMGGHVGGEVAARTAIDTLQKTFDAEKSASGLMAAARRANREVYRASSRDADLHGMGTTLTAAALVEDPSGSVVALINVGDSRAYLYEGGELKRVTNDHSVVEEMVRSGEITEAQALVHPHRHILTRAIGIYPSVEIDAWIIKPHGPARLLLCSDGLTNECNETEIAGVLESVTDPTEAARQLVARAVDHGGNDNVTAVVVDIAGHQSGDLDEAGSATSEIRALTRGSARGARRVSARRSTPRAEHTKAEHKPSMRLVTPRVALFVFLLVAIFGGTAGFIYWYVTASYFVGVHGTHVAIYQGRPGGLLWFQPKVVEDTSLSTSQVLAPNLALLREGLLESSYTDAQDAVSRLSSSTLLGIPATTTTTTSLGSATTGTK